MLCTSSLGGTTRERSARLLNMGPQRGLGGQELRVLLVPQVIAGAERAELARKRTERAREFLGINIHAHEHVMAGEPAARDDLSHRTPPSQIINPLRQHRCSGKVPPVELAAGEPTLLASGCSRRSR